MHSGSSLDHSHATHPYIFLKQLEESLQCLLWVGEPEVDDLTKGALVVKEDLAKVELYGCMAALRDVRAKCVKMNECIMKVG